MERREQGATVLSLSVRGGGAAEGKRRGEQACGDATRGAEGAKGVVSSTIESGVFAVVSEGGRGWVCVGRRGEETRRGRDVGGDGAKAEGFREGGREGRVGQGRAAERRAAAKQSRAEKGRTEQSSAQQNRASERASLHLGSRKRR